MPRKRKPQARHHPARRFAVITYLILGATTNIILVIALSFLPATRHPETQSLQSTLTMIGLSQTSVSFGATRREWTIFNSAGVRPAFARLVSNSTSRSDDPEIPGFRFSWAWSLGGDHQWGKLPDTTDSPHVQGVEDARGWPALAFWCELDDPQSNTPPGSHNWQPYIQGAIPLPDWKPPSSSSLPHPPPKAITTRAIPYRPIWYGIIANTLFYAAGWWLLITTTRSTRHLRRYRKGHCPNCAYDLKSDYTTGCPECGWNRPAESPT